MLSLLVKFALVWFGVSVLFVGAMGAWLRRERWEVVGWLVALLVLMGLVVWLEQ